MLDSFLTFAVSIPRAQPLPFDWLVFPLILIIIVCALFATWWFFLRGKLKTRFLKKIFGYFEKSKASALFEKKRQLLQELEVAEQKFLKREIPEENYKSLVGKKQQELIKIDALLSKHVPVKELPQSELAEVEPKNRHLLKGLLEEKQKYQQEITLAQNRYFKRKIDEKTYQGIVNSGQAKIIEIDGRIKSIMTTQGIKRAFFDLKEKLKTEQQDFAKKEQAEIERIAKEILAQLEKSGNNNF